MKKGRKGNPGCWTFGISRMTPSNRREAGTVGSVGGHSILGSYATTMLRTISKKKAAQSMNGLGCRIVLKPSLFENAASWIGVRGSTELGLVQGWDWEFGHTVANFGLELGIETD
jgi:hypothetical protein